jgi:hypothetical protein
VRPWASIDCRLCRDGGTQSIPEWADKDAPARVGVDGLSGAFVDGKTVKIDLGIVLKMRQTQTFLAIIRIDPEAMKTLAVIMILALLTITGAAYTDILFTADQATGQRAN